MSDSRIHFHSSPDVDVHHQAYSDFARQHYAPPNHDFVAPGSVSPRAAIAAQAEARHAEENQHKSHAAECHRSQPEPSRTDYHSQQMAKNKTEAD